MRCLLFLVVLVSLFACRSRHKRVYNATPYERFAQLEGIYKVEDEQVSEQSCDEPYVIFPIPTLRIQKLSAKSSFGYQTLFLFPCQKANKCDEPDPPLFVPFVSDSEGDELVGEYSRTANYSKSRQKCFLGRTEVRVTERSGKLEVKLIESEGLLDVPMERCTAFLATERKSELSCRKITKSILSRTH